MKSAASPASTTDVPASESPDPGAGASAASAVAGERGRDWLSLLVARRANRRRALWAWCALLGLPSVAFESTLGLTVIYPQQQAGSYLTVAGLAAILGCAALGAWVLRADDRWRDGTDEVLYSLPVIGLFFLCIYAILGVLLLIAAPMLGTAVFVWLHPFWAISALGRGPEHLTHRRIRRFLLFTAIPPFSAMPLIAIVVTGMYSVSVALIVIGYGLLIGYCLYTREHEKRFMKRCAELGIAMHDAEAEQLCLSYGWRFYERIPLEELALVPGMSKRGPMFLGDLLREMALQRGIPSDEKEPWMKGLKQRESASLLAPRRGLTMRPPTDFRGAR